MFSHALIKSPDPRFVIQIHGGAWAIPEALSSPHAEGVKRAYQASLAALQAGDAPLQAVLAALKVMENDPAFDAGTGSFLNEDGEVELDAAVMEGIGLKAGAVASVGRFKNPCEIALAVMERTDHVLLIGNGAERFALAEGFTPVDPRSLVHPREYEGYQAWVKAGKPDARAFFAEEGKDGDKSEPHKRGTVGVVLGVHNGAGYDLYAGLSTGGTRGKKAGRVGDTPLVGCGLYADNEGAAVCCTGWGEAFIRTAAAKSVSDLIAHGVSPQEAVEAVLATIFRRTQGRGGILAIGPDGRTGAAFTTPDMAYAGPQCRYLPLEHENLKMLSCHREAGSRLATYGTLAPGRVNHHHLAGLKGSWRRGTVRGRLAVAGRAAPLGYPGLILDPQGSPVEVHLFESPQLPNHWSRLDEFEGAGYRRVVTQVQTAEGEVDACIYVLASEDPPASPNSI
jgi:beta-aspartyl-peptidase (threonine type)